MADTQDNSLAPSRLAGKWQAPAFMLSVIAFALAAGYFAARRPGPDWDDSFAVAEQLMLTTADGNYSAAEQAANALLAEAQADRDRLRRLYGLLAEIRRRSIEFTHDRSDEQLATLVKLYELAQDHGHELTVDEALRVADACEQLGRLDSAEQYNRQAVAIDPALAPQRLRTIIALRQRQGEPAGSLLALLADYLALGENLTDEQYGWAVGLRCDLLVAAGRLDDVDAMLADSLAATDRPGYRHQLLFHQARQLIRRADAAAAEAGSLRTQADDILIDLLASINGTDSLYPPANLLRGRLICRDNPEEAIRVFEAVLERAPASACSAAAREGLALAFGRLGQPERALEHFGRAVEELRARPINPYLNLAQVRRSLAAARQTLLRDSQPDLALRYVQAEQDVLNAEQPPVMPAERLDLLFRLGETHLAVARQAREQLVQAGPLAQADAKAALAAKATDGFRRAGEVFRRRAALASKDFNDIHGESLWLSAQAFDQAALRAEAIAALKEFIQTRPSDSQVREALFRLGQACQALGDYDAAIAAYQRNLHMSPQGERHVMATAGRIPMAMCYVAKGEPFYDQAERILRDILDDEEMFTPDSEVYREALFALGKLLFERKQWSQAVVVLGEAIQRDPGRPVRLGEPDVTGQRGKYLRAARSEFLMAECYRRAGLDLGAKAAAETNMLHRDQRLDEMQDQLIQADLTYAHVIARLEALDGQLSELDRAYRRNSYFARGDCLYALGDYAGAIERYEEAIFLFQTDPAVMGGLMQIYNCYVELGRMEYARAAVNRARVLLAGVETDKLNDRALQLSEASWQWWLDSLQTLDPHPAAKEAP